MIARTRAYLLAAVTFGLGFVLAILLSQYLPGQSSYYRRMDDRHDNLSRDVVLPGRQRKVRRAATRGRADGDR